MLTCFAGCELDVILGAIGLERRDPFSGTKKPELRFRSLRRLSPGAVQEAITRELDRVSDTLREQHGYDPPLRASHVNEARARVARVYGVELHPITPFAWECPPHDADPLWPALFERTLEEVTYERWHAIHAAAPAWQTDPHGPTKFDRFKAEERAASWLRKAARSERA